ncbi:MAG: DUF554 domain-containing protein [Prevotella sp.]|jgi:uncharacterized membrane protein YqgA involved in biofilm formation|nr:DUF554 domain-containing protein [Prevotella sp.]MBR6138118.1 DUF554 domain-containing protein [Prevotella sp.]
MLGTIVNTICIVIGSTAGSIMRRRIDSTIQTALFNAMGIVTLALGANMAVQNLPKSQYPVLFIVSIALGSVIGFKLDIAGKIERYAARHNASRLAEGLTTSCLLYCIGTLSIVGPVLSAVYGNNTYLYTNATLDLVSSAVFAATYGWGIMLGALVLFCWQGSIYAVAYFLNSSDFIPETLMAELSIVGGLLLISSGLAILNIKDCKTVNMLPALAFPVLFYIIKSFI